MDLLATTEARSLVAPAVAAPRGAGVRMKLTLGVDDVDLVCARLAERGVTLLNGPMDRR